LERNIKVLYKKLKQNVICALNITAISNLSLTNTSILNFKIHQAIHNIAEISSFVALDASLNLGRLILNLMNTGIILLLQMHLKTTTIITLPTSMKKARIKTKIIRNKLYFILIFLNLKESN